MEISCFNGTNKFGIDDVALSISSTQIYFQTVTLMPLLYDRCDPSTLDTFNCSKDEFLFYSRGEKVSNMWLAIPVTVAYTLIFLAGVIGNLSVCIIIIRNHSMHTSTNYYLFNLAVSDLLYLLLGLPFEIYMFWNQYPWPFGLNFCKLRSLFSDSCSYSTVLTIVSFTVERYIAICHPIYSYAMANFKRVLYVITFIWAFSLISATPVALNRHLQFVRYPPMSGSKLPESALCTLNTNIKGWYEASTLIFFVIPLVIIIVMYTKIASKLNSREKNRNSGRLGVSEKRAKSLKSKKSIVRILCAIVITFFISWAPFHCQRLVFIYGKNWPYYSQINETLFTFAGVFYYLSCTINPIIYNVMSNRYRAAFRQTFCARTSTNNNSNKTANTR